MPNSVFSNSFYYVYTILVARLCFKIIRELLHLKEGVAYRPEVLDVHIPIRMGSLRCGRLLISFTLDNNYHSNLQFQICNNSRLTKIIQGIVLVFVLLWFAIKWMGLHYTVILACLNNIMQNSKDPFLEVK